MPRAIVGFDFGTDSTKIVYRMRDTDAPNHVNVLRIDDPDAASLDDKDRPRYPAFATPSRVCVVDGLIRLGYCTLAPWADCGPPLKVRLWDEECEWPEDTPEQRARRQADKELAVKRYGDPNVLTVAYLAWAFRRVREQILRDHAGADIEIYMPAPMDQYGDEGPIKKVFFKAMAAGWRLAFENANQGIDLNDGAAFPPIEAAAKRELLAVAQGQVPEQDERLFDVLPESLVPLVTLMYDPIFRPGYYLIVDCGGGSTEISVVLRYDDGQAVSCFEDRALNGGWYQLRDAKAHAPTRFDALLKDLSTESKEIVHRSYLKVRGNPVASAQFRECVHILLLGGGMLDGTVEDSFYRESRSPLMQYLGEQQMEEDNIPKASLEQLASQLGVADGEARFLMVARGLAVGKIALPTFFAPHDVPPVHSEVQEERNPLGHWVQ
jgi:hypothetical protein